MRPMQSELPSLYNISSALESEVNFGWCKQVCFCNNILFGNKMNNILNRLAFH